MKIVGNRFFIQHQALQNDFLDDVRSAIKTWCVKNINCNHTKIVTKRKVVILDDEFQLTICVNCIDHSHRNRVIKYVRKDLNKNFNMDMVCREQVESDAVLFTLLVITSEKPMVQKIRHQFTKYGDFDTVVKTDRATCMNFQNYNDARDAHLNSKMFVVSIGNLMVCPLAIQFIKMLMHFEQHLLD